MYLIFYNSFNQCVKDCISQSIIYLKFSKDFNQSINDCIRSKAHDFRQNLFLSENEICRKPTSKNIF